MPLLRVPNRPSLGSFLAVLAAGSALVIAPADAGATACATTACGTVTSVTYNGTALTLADSSTNGTVRTEIWYLVAPATGTHNIVVKAPVATDVTASSISFSGVNQATPLGTLVKAIGTSTTPSVVANSILGEPVVDFVGAVGTTTPTVSGPTQTVHTTDNTATGLKHVVIGNSTAYGQATPTTMSWTIPSADWAIAAVPVKASTPLTGVDVGSFTATWGDHATRVVWSSGYQPSTVGFYVYRSDGLGARTQLNQQLIAGGAIAGTLSSFSWTDATDGWNGDVSYWLKEIKLDGTSTWYGPASPVPPPSAGPASPGVVATRDGGVSDAGPSGAGGFGGAWSSFGGSTGSPGSPAEVSTISRTGGCAIYAPGGPPGVAGLLLVAAAIGSARRRRRWIRPLVVLALVLGAGLWGQRTAVATGGVAIDATATATGASGLTFAHTVGSSSNRLLVVGVVTPISCTDTTTDSGSCGVCGATCSLDTTSLSSGLLALWHLDEGTGATSADASGNGNTASLISSPAWTSGYSNNAIQGNGTSSYAQGLVGTWFGGNNPLTASAWVYTTSNTNGPVFGVSSIPSGGGWNMPFLSVQGATVYGWTWQNTAITSTVSLDAWHLLTLTYDPSGTSTKLYVDGAFAGSGTGTYNASGLADYWTTYIPGAKPTMTMNSYLLGRVDEVRAYNRVLSVAEISALYTARLGCSASMCAACGTGKASCSGSCVVTATDNANCGGCGLACNTTGGETCSSSTCVCSNGSLTDCSSNCVDTTTDSNHCGACGTVCGNSTPAFVDASLVGHWALDEGTGATSADSSGNSRTATLTNSPTWSSGYSGSGLTFDGASNYLTATLGTWFGGNNPLTASAWVYATATTDGPIFGVAAPPAGSGWNMPFLSIHGATVYGHLWQVNGNVALSATVSLGAWHHLAITYDPTVGEKFYVDGTLSSSATGTYSPSGVSDILSTYIPGTKPMGVNNQYLKGEIDEVRAYSRVLSAAEIGILAHSHQSCAGSVCGGCGGGLTVCSSTCTNVTADPANCGSCGHACNIAGGETCVAGTCGCATGMDCSTVCIDTTTSSTNCGACGNDCGTTTCSSCSQGLLGFWHLDEGTGSTSADASGNSRTATLTGSPTWTTGQSGNALTFNGTTNYLNASLGTWYGGNNTISVAAWVYATSTTSGPIFGVTDAPPGGNWNMPFLSILGSTVYGWFWQVNGNTPLSATVSLNAWHFLVATYDPAVGEKFYVDGALSGSGTGTFSPSGASDTWTTYIPGARPNGNMMSDHLNGTIDEVRAYNRVLSSGEVKLLYDAHLACTGSACSGCPSGMTSCSGACTNTQADKNNCNGCGIVCGGAQTCVAGTCM